MATAEERMKILEMVREGKISPEEGSRLLQALQAGGKKSASGRDPRWLHIRITDLSTGQAKVNVNIPMFAPSSANINYSEVMDAIRAGNSGKIVDIEDQGEGERVEIWSE